MSEKGQAARVGVRKLRQNLSVCLGQVKAGDTLAVTQRGRVVARLAPALPERVPVLERLIAEGRATPAAGAILRHEPIDIWPGRALSLILEEMRDAGAR